MDQISKDSASGRTCQTISMKGKDPFDYLERVKTKEAPTPPSRPPSRDAIPSPLAPFPDLWCVSDLR